MEDEFIVKNKSPLCANKIQKGHFSIKVTVQVTMFTFERVEYACQI